jgi:general stress protein CsbA
VSKHSQKPFVGVDRGSHDLLRESVAESDLKFWTGQRPISPIQWIGLILMMVAVAVALKGWIGNEYGIFLFVMACLVLIVVVGNYRNRRKGRHLPR